MRKEQTWRRNNMLLKKKKRVSNIIKEIRKYLGDIINTNEMKTQTYKIYVI